MARIVAASVEMQDLVNGRWFEITVGGLDSFPVVRGDNVVLPSKPGQTYMTKVEDHTPVTLHGTVYGTGAAPGESYYDKMAALKTAFDPTVGTFDIVVHPDATGVGGKLGTGETATITVEFLRFTGPPAVGDQVRTFDIECIAIGDPPTWVVAGS